MNPPSIDPHEAAPSRRSGLALASVLLGFSGIVLCLGPLTGIPAVICGHRAQARIRESGGALRGMGLATVGKVTGYLAIAWIIVIGMMAALAIPSLAKVRKQAQYRGCQNNLQIIQEGKTIWALHHSKEEDAIPTDLDLFGPSKPVNQKPICPGGGTYKFHSVQESPTCSVHGAIASE